MNFGLIRRSRAEEPAPARHNDDPNPAVALLVGLVYLFRTSPGARLMRELEAAVRKYSADPAALWRLVRQGQGDVLEGAPDDGRALPQPPRVS
jgi:hypothetical protein